jgi:very-short-patch-repair endonuclease
MPGTRKVGTRRARALRQAMTPAERRLWWHLGRVPVENTHFRRQASIGPYVVNFVCPRAKLVIEFDGGHHSRDDCAARDQIRSRWLESEGYHVIRFWNAELAENLDGVLDTIYAALYGSLQSEASPPTTRPGRARRTDPRPRG